MMNRIECAAEDSDLFQSHSERSEAESKNPEYSSSDGQRDPSTALGMTIAEKRIKCCFAAWREK